MTTSQPLLYLDVDGVLNPYAAHPRRRPPGYQAHYSHGYPLLLNPDHGPALAALPYTLTWATDWEELANAAISPVLDLPALPFLVFDDDSPDRRLHHKTHTILHHAQGHPFVWLDDETTNHDRAFLDRHHPSQALLITTDPAVGLNDAHLDPLIAFARHLEETA